MKLLKGKILSVVELGEGCGFTIRAGKTTYQGFSHVGLMKGGVYTFYARFVRNRGMWTAYWNAPSNFDFLAIPAFSCLTYVSEN